MPGLTIDSREIEIGGDEFHHITHVMRHSVGASLLLTSGDGVLADVVVTAIGRHSLRARVTATRTHEKSRPRLACAFSLLRGKHDHLIVEKLTELGVSAFYPFTCEHSVRRPSGNTTARFVTVATAAMKQCDGAFLPLVHDTQPLRQTLDAIRAAGYTPLVASETECGSLLPVALGKVTGDMCLVIGPEGGWSEAEREWFEAEGLHTVSLGNHVLRAETAAIAGAGMVVGAFLSGNSEFY
ncbi:MAG: 16S rRNA (uracil(1498)-N(3))-methyltransferase [Candidatus Cloacimonetes bacterium]|nr:16S rRNA (uracil(1498)-N(3))-methyltransferase [Candidatus Cloacimonadota bacterium]